MASTHSFSLSFQPSFSLSTSLSLNFSLPLSLSCALLRCIHNLNTQQKKIEEKSLFLFPVIWNTGADLRRKIESRSGIQRNQGPTFGTDGNIISFKKIHPSRAYPVISDSVLLFCKPFFRKDAGHQRSYYQTKIDTIRESINLSNLSIPVWGRC